MPDLDELLAAEAERYDIRQYPLEEIRARRRRRVQGRVAAVLSAAAVAGVAAVSLPGLDSDRDQVVADGRPALVPHSQDPVTAGQPELGQVPTPPEVLRTLPKGTGRGAPPPPPDGTVDVLARHTDSGVNVGTYGWISGSTFCMTRFVDKPSYGQTSQEPAACGPIAQDWNRLGFSRSLGLQPAGQLKQVIWGFAPAGTAQVRLTAPGQEPLVVPAFRAGSAWRDGLHFAATWPAKTPVTVTALAEDGSEIDRLSE
jgi:hypothetical protein